MKVTIKKIAEVANVSRGTVDRALNHRPGINPEVAQRILKIADELGYQPDPAAKALAARRYVPKKIGVLLCSEGNPFFRKVIEGVDHALEELQHFGIESIQVNIKGFDSQVQIQKIDELVSQGINGLVLTPINSEDVAEKLRSLKQQGIQVVTINTDIAKVQRLAYVGCDYLASGQVAGELMGMMSNGMQEQIAIVIGSRQILAQDMRLQGIQDTLKSDFPNVSVKAVLENNDDDERSYELVKKLLEESPDITRLCFAAAGVAGGLRALKERKLERKIKVITYDLTDIVRENIEQGLVSATVCQEPFRQGYLGVEIMGKYLLYGQKPEKSVVHTHVFISTKYNL
jgi:LacI family transcriptional regulator